MIHAFFNIRLDDAYLPERTGQVVRDVEEARAVARTIVRRLVVRHGGEPRLLNAVMAVTDADGARVLDLSFFEALYVPVAAPERAGADSRAGADLRRMAIAAPGEVAAAIATLTARLRTPAMPPRLGAAFRQARVHLATIADRLSSRRDQRQRFTLAVEPGR